MQAQYDIADCATNEGGGAMPPGYQGRDNRRSDVRVAA